MPVAAVAVTNHEIRLPGCVDADVMGVKIAGHMARARPEQRVMAPMARAAVERVAKAPQLPQHGDPKPALRGMDAHRTLRRRLKDRGRAGGVGADQERFASLTGLECKACALIRQPCRELSRRRQGQRRRCGTAKN